MPSFAGLPVFGVNARLSRATNPRASQRNAYGGLSGVEQLDQGLRGRYTRAEFRFVGDTAADLNSAELLMESYIDGNPYTLVDQYGNAWPDVLLESFEPTSKVMQFTGGGWTRTYRAELFHLS